jgi:tRNA(His) 5'-end guanylyltransferase
MISFGFIEPLYSINRNKLINNLYRKCYWYFIKNNILSVIKILNGKKEDKKHRILYDAMSVIYNHLCIEKM